MENAWTYDENETLDAPTKAVIRSAYQENDRRMRAVEIVKYFKSSLESMFDPMTAKEMLSSVMRQRGVPSVDKFTKELVGAYRVGLGCPGEVEGQVRKIMVIGRWMSTNSRVHMWMLEPVVSSTLIYGNSLSVASAKENFSKYLDVVDPISMTTRNIMITDNRMQGRWAGWLASMELERVSMGNPTCVSCNMSGTSLMFAISYLGMKTINMIPTPESIHVLGAYSKSVCMKMNATSSVLAKNSTKLKLQPSIDSFSSTHITMYGNGSVQYCGSPKHIEHLTSCLIEIVRTVMDTEMFPFLMTMRVVGMDEI
jgi:hypothetical protein